MGCTRGIGVIKIRALFCQYVVYWGRIIDPNVSKGQAKKFSSSRTDTLYLECYNIVFFQYSGCIYIKRWVEVVQRGLMGNTISNLVCHNIPHLGDFCVS